VPAAELKNETRRHSRSAWRKRAGSDRRDQVADSSRADDANRQQLDAEKRHHGLPMHTDEFPRAVKKFTSKGK